VKCFEVMTKNPVCCLATDDLETVARHMQLEDIGSLPVVDSYEDRRLIGIITDRDMALRVLASGRDPRWVRVNDVMTPEPVTCHPMDDLDTALEVMAQYQLRRIPIVEDSGQIVGIIAQADVATRLHNAPKTAEVIEGISQPS
jgi:CBS domain-containing protein